MCVGRPGVGSQNSPQTGAQDPEIEQTVPVPLCSKGPKAYTY